MSAHTLRAWRFPQLWSRLFGRASKKRCRSKPARLQLEPLEDRSVPTANLGGFTGGGLVGDYFNNTTLSGTPSFVRTDVRVDFQWNSGEAPGGSSAPGFNAVSANNFSAKWTGSIIPAFSETYTFQTNSNSGVRLFVNGQQIINDWTAHNATVDTGSITLTGGTTYSIELDYYYQGGSNPAVAQLKWQSPSTPLQSIQAFDGLAYYAGGADLKVALADAMKQSARDYWLVYNGSGNFTNTNASEDANGWPIQDASLLLWDAGSTHHDGTYSISFTGKATDIEAQFGLATFSNYAYNSSTNTSTVTMVVTNTGQINFNLAFGGTTDPASSTGKGVSNVHIWCPTQEGGTTDFAPGTIFQPQDEQVLSRFVAFRDGTNNANNETTWATRTNANWFNLTNPAVSGSGGEGNGTVWEYAVALSNETGKDMYLVIPAGVDNQYITNLADLIKYGSDGVNPYTSPQTNPVWAPLNPNLHVILEYANETWNYSAGVYSAVQKVANQAITDYLNGNTSAADYADGQAIDYDGAAGTTLPVNSGNTLILREHAARTIDISNIFRSIYGDAALGTTILPVLEWQYDNAGFPATASTSLEFMDNYYNNADGQQHVSTPHPVNYYIWGGGGAVYYDSNNETGIVANNPFANPSFATPTVSGYQQTPTGASWAFTGDAGIAANGSSLGNPNSPSGTQAAYVGNNATISQTFSVPAASTYALQFSASGTTSNSYSFTVSIDGGPTSSYYVGTSYKTVYTPVFTTTGAGSHTVTITGTGGSTGHIFITNVQLDSTDAIFASLDFSPTSGYVHVLNTEAAWAQAYGLQEVSYEGGWALGENQGEPPITEYAKFQDPRAKTANLNSIQDFQRAGSALYDFGTYLTWDDYAKANNEPIVQSMDAAGQQLPVTPTNGTPAPNVLGLAATSVSNNTTFNTIGGAGSFVVWNAIIPQSGNYTISAPITGSSGSTATANLQVDGTVLTSGTANSTLSVSTFLTAGLHSIRIQSTGGTIGFSQVTVGGTNAPGSPTLTATDSDGSATLSWTTVSGATGYQLRYGTSPGNYTTILNEGTSTSQTITGLTDGTAYYFAVSAINSSGIGLPSNQVGVTPLADNQVGALAAWNFNNLLGIEYTDPVTSSSSKVTVSPITHGPGLANSSNNSSFNSQESNSFGIYPVGNVYQTTLAGALSAGQYVQFTLTPAAGRTISLSNLTFTPYVQVTTNSGAGISFSTDGGNTFSAPITASGTIGTNGSPFTVDLSGQSTLQNTSGPVVIRIAVYGNGNYCIAGIGKAAGNNLVVTGSFSALPSSGVTQVNLASAFNRTGIVSDGSTFSGGGFDGQGNALSSNLLGASPTYNGLTYALGALGGNNVVSGTGQTIPVTSGNYSTLNLLAAHVNGSVSGDTITVNYSDGTSQTFGQGFSDWHHPQNYAGEANAIPMAYRDAFNGTTQNGGSGTPYYLYSYSLGLNAAKTVTSILVPNDANLEIVAIDLVAATPPQRVSLAGAYNRNGIVADGATFSGGLDGGGSALSANLLGTSQTWNGNTFNIAAAGGNNVVSATGQTITVNQGAYTTLSLLADHVNGSVAGDSITVNFTDGTTQTLTQGFSDWHHPQGYTNESQAFTMAYKDSSNGTTVNGGSGTPYVLYGYSFTLTPGKTVSSITLPNDNNLEVVALDLS